MAFLLIENIKLAVTAIRSHLLRTILTILIIAFGITALVGILTAIESIKGSINSNFARLGANTFSIRNFSMGLRHGGQRPDRYRNITYNEAIAFKQRFSFPASVSIYTRGTQMATVKYRSEKTNPNIALMGSDENYLLASGYELERGRNFSQTELQKGSYVAIAGSEIIKTLFKTGEEPLDQFVSIGPAKFKIIGLLREKGSSMGFSGDKTCIIPIQNLRQYISGSELSYTILVMVNDPQMIDAATSEATGLFRTIRKVPLGQRNNFETEKK
jgi:putative ABC transport system permease protein